MDRIIPMVCEILSAIILVGLIGAWLALIVRKQRALGPMAPLHDREWFKDVFRQGLEILKRSRWILVILFIGTILLAGESFLTNLFFLKKHPELPEQLPPEFFTPKIVQLYDSLFKVRPSTAFSTPRLHR